MDLIRPEWPAPAHVQAAFTTRQGGVSQGIYQGLNLGLHVGDAAELVMQNRQQLAQQLALPATPIWLEQVHGTDVLCAEMPLPHPPQADAAVTSTIDLPLTVMTADCLPVLFCDKAGTVVASAHAGWRGLCAGVLEKTIAAMQVAPDEILAWIGPAIGPTAFEVGDEVKAAFVAHDPQAETAFVTQKDNVAQKDKWLADLFMLARQRIRATGVSAIYGGNQCTFSDAEQFYSYRRDGQTGRMAGLIWLTIKS
jgi:YfiH family protein